MLHPGILFIPVSCPQGIGEYMRSLIIAQHLSTHYSNADIRFVLSKHAPYVNDCPYQTYTSKSSATKDTASVKRAIDDFKPNLVIFDCAGRAKQFAYAQKSGAKVVFISQHKRKRSKGLRLKRLINCDLHWVVQPDFLMPPLSYYAKLKLNYFNKPAPKNIGSVFLKPDLQRENTFLAQHQLNNQTFFLFNAGSGGHQLDNQLAADIFYQAAREFSHHCNITCVMLFGSNYPKAIPGNSPQLINFSNIDNLDFISLLKNARGCVISAGDTMLQSIALQKSCVAVPIAKDQPTRLKICQQLGLVIGASLDKDHIMQQAKQLTEHNRLQSMQDNIQKYQQIDALEVITADVELLLDKLISAA